MRKIRYAVIAASLAAVAAEPASCATFNVVVSTFGPISTSSVTSSPAGINCGNGGTTCTFAFTAGTTVTLTAFQGSTAAFAGWGGVDGCRTSSAQCSTLASKARAISAKFDPVLSVSLYGNGLGTVKSSTRSIDCSYLGSCAGGAPLRASFSSGTSIVLVSSPATNSTFVGWTGNGGCSTASTCTFTLSGYTAVVATFTSAGPFNIRVNKGGTGSGTITSSPAGIDCGDTCSASFAANASVTLTTAAASGSRFVGWANGGCSGSTTVCVVLSTSAQQGLGGTASPAAFFYK